jgi:capsular polysaccharide biosynthesis protein
MFRRVTRVLADWRIWVALVGTVVAFGVAAIVSGTVDRSWRAETTVVVGTGGGPLRPGEDGATRELAGRLDDLVRSDQLAGNVVSTLHLRESRSALLGRISVGVPEPGLLRIGVREANPLRAQQVAQEIGFIYPQLVERRFPRLKATVWDPAHLEGRDDREWGRNLGIAAAVAVLLWVVALGSLLLRRAEARPAAAEAPVTAPAPPPDVPAPPAPGPERVIATPEPVPPPEPEAEPEPEPEPAPAPEPEPVAATVAEPGDWNLHELDRLVRERSGEFPERAEEWEIYLESIRDYAGPDGRLPATLDWLVWDTFGDLLERGERT